MILVAFGDGDGTCVCVVCFCLLAFFQQFDVIVVQRVMSRESPEHQVSALLDV